MPFSYHPPTRTKCSVCEELDSKSSTEPIIDTHAGKASSANNFAFHNWYNFVLGYSPEFPEYMLRRESMDFGHLIADPFMGSGTTLVTCKQLGIASQGIDANDFMVDAARVKLSWDLDVTKLRGETSQLIELLHQEMALYKWHSEESDQQLPLFESRDGNDYRELIENSRPDMLKEKYICDRPLARALLIDDVIKRKFQHSPFKQIYDLALTSIIVPISNVRYGPGFGIAKPRHDVDVLSIYADKLSRMLQDLTEVDDNLRDVTSRVILGDARELRTYMRENSVDLMITSPPYPGDHEYTKHTRLELIFRGYASNIEEFRRIKKRMLRASTTNIYKNDNDREPILDLQSIQKITELIDERLEADGATSGFEKLYTKLVWEYFGGMYKSLLDCWHVLKPGGKISLLVSDSHAFKMVHIQTADILEEIGLRVGYVNPEIILWQLKPSTSHKYSLRENILVLQKPE